MNQDTPEDADDHRGVINQIKAYTTAGLTRVIVDATDPGVIVPAQHKDNRRLALNLSSKFAKHEMKFTPQALFVTLTIDNERFRCTLPWQAFRAASPVEQVPQKQAPRHLSVVK